MFNVCVLSGLVLTEPELIYSGAPPEAMFELGIALGPYKAGSIKVNCSRNLAAVAVNAIHRGDRVAVVGIIGRDVYGDEKKEGPTELVMVAHDLELVMRTSPSMGMIVSDEKPEP